MKTIKGTLNFGRFEIPYRRYGDHPNMLMCVSGALQTMAIWRTVVKRFTDHFTVVIFDMPGIGRSEIKSGGAHVTVQEQMETLHALLEETRSEGELTLAGSSWGTALAAAYAAVRPDAVQHLVLSSFGMKPNAVMEEIVRRAVILYNDGEYARGGDLILEMFGNQLGDAYKRQIIAQFNSLNKAHAEHLVRLIQDQHLDLGEVEGAIRRHTPLPSMVIHLHQTRATVRVRIRVRERVTRAECP